MDASPSHVLQGYSVPTITGIGTQHRVPGAMLSLTSKVPSQTHHRVIHVYDT